MNKREMIYEMVVNNAKGRHPKMAPNTYIIFDVAGDFIYNNSNLCDINNIYNGSDEWEIYTPTLTFLEALEEMKKGKICQMVGTNRICRWNNKLETKSQENEWIPEIYLSVNSAYSSNWQLVEEPQDKKYSIFGILERYAKDGKERKYITKTQDKKNKFIQIFSDRLLSDFDYKANLYSGKTCIHYEYLFIEKISEEIWQEVIE